MPFEPFWGLPSPQRPVQVRPCLPAQRTCSKQLILPTFTYLGSPEQHHGLLPPFCSNVLSSVLTGLKAGQGSHKDGDGSAAPVPRDQGTCRTAVLATDQSHHCCCCELPACCVHCSWWRLSESMTQLLRGGSGAYQKPGLLAVADSTVPEPLTPAVLPCCRPCPSSEKQHVSAFFDGSGPGALRWSYQVSRARRVARRVQRGSRAHAQHADSCMVAVHTLQVPEEKNKDGNWVPKGTKPVLQLSHQQVSLTPPPASLPWCQHRCRSGAVQQLQAGQQTHTCLLVAATCRT
jgi:hypothetical protein